MNSVFLQEISSKTNDEIEFKQQEQLSEEYFDALIDISSIHSEKVINALRDFLVTGYTRPEACARNNVSQSYFSISLHRLMRIKRIVMWLARYY